MGVTRDRFKKAFGGGVSDALLAERQSKVREAMKELKAAVDTLQAIGTDPGDHLRALHGFAIRFNNINKQPSGNKGIYEDLESLKNEARNAAAAAQRAARNDPKAAAGLGKLLADTRCGGDAKAGNKAAVARMFAADTQLFTKLAALPGGNQVIDGLMKQMGESAGNTADQDFAKAAIVARYGITTLDGTLNAKSLPALYRTLGMVPESHARNNPLLRDVSVGTAGGGDYTGGKLNLNCARPGDFSRDQQFRPDPDDNVNPAWIADGDEHSHFDETTLHEVGHAVDDQMGWMGARSGQAAFGGWGMTTEEALIQKAGDHFGFFDDFEDDFSRYMLERVLMQALKGGDIGRKDWELEKSKADAMPSRQTLMDDAGLKQIEVERLRLVQGGWVQSDVDKTFNGLKPAIKGFAYFTANEAFRRMRQNRTAHGQAVDEAMAQMAGVGDPPGDKDWDTMMKHACITWCKQAGAGEAWKLGTARAKKVAAMDGKAYTRDKSGWYFYDPAARAKAISKYQFNTPAEWFAELYAAYYLHKLPEGHPDYKWLANQVHNYRP